MSVGDKDYRTGMMQPGTAFAKDAALTEENRKLREHLESCAKLLWKLDEGGYINVLVPDDDAGREEERQCEHLASLARDAVKDAQALLTPNK